MFPVFSDVLIKRVVQQVHGHHDGAILRLKVKSTWIGYIDLMSILSLFCSKLINSTIHEYEYHLIL